MALEVKVSRDYRKIEKHDDQYDFGTLVIGKLTLNAATFPALPISVAALTTINNNYLIKINAAKGGDHDAIVARDLYRDNTWIPAFDEEAEYIDEDVADGDENIINLSGFNATKAAKEDATLPKQMHLEMKSLIAGEGKYSSDTENVGKDTTYVLVGKPRNIASFTQDADGKLIIEITAPCTIVVAPVRKKKGTLKGLPSEEKMDFVIMGVNAAGVGPISAEAKVIIQ